MVMSIKVSEEQPSFCVVFPNHSRSVHTTARDIVYTQSRPYDRFHGLLIGCRYPQRLSIYRAYTKGVLSHENDVNVAPNP